MSHLTTPAYYPAYSPRLNEIIESAKSGRGHTMLIIGDSQESASGTTFYTALVARFAEMFGGGLSGLWGFTTSSNAYPFIGNFLAGCTTVTLTATSVLPMFDVAAFRAQRLPVVGSTNALGNVLRPDSIENESFFFSQGRRWHNNSESKDRERTRAVVYGVDSTLDALSVATLLRWGWATNAAAGTVYDWVACSNQGDATITATAPGWWKADVPAPSAWTNEYLRLLLKSGHASDSLTVQLVKIYREGVGGIDVLMTGDGGTRSDDLLAGHASCGPMLTTINPSIVMFGYGSNDAYFGTTAAQWKINMQANIDFIKSHVPDALIVITTDVYRGDADNDATYLSRRALHSTYATTCKELCDENTNVVMLNELKLGDEVGWNSVSENFDKTSIIDWSAATTYNQGDIVRTPENGQNFATRSTYKYWRSNKASNLNRVPGAGTDVSHNQVFWSPIARHTLDYVHETPMGGLARANWVVNSLWQMGTNRINNLTLSSGTTVATNPARYSRGNSIK